MTVQRAVLVIYLAPLIIFLSCNPLNIAMASSTDNNAQRPRRAQGDSMVREPRNSILSSDGSFRLDSLPMNLTADEILAGSHAAWWEKHISTEIYDSSAALLLLELERILNEDPWNRAAVDLLASIAENRVLRLVRRRCSEAEEKWLNDWYEVAKKARDYVGGVQNLRFEPLFYASQIEKDIQVAVQLAEAAMRKEPDRPHAYVARARLALLNNELGTAKRSARRALKLNETYSTLDSMPDPRVLIPMGKTLAASEQRELAAQANIILAIACARGGDVEEARKAVLRAKQLLKLNKTRIGLIFPYGYEQLKRVGLAE